MAAQQDVAADPPAAEEGFSEAPAEAAPETPMDEPAVALAPPPPAPGSFSDAIAGGKPIFEARSRYEFVDQKRTAVLRDLGESFTLRTRLGWETADWNGLRGLIEFEDVRDLAGERYAVNSPGAATPPFNGADKARFPIVNDPSVTEVNRLQLAWTPNAATAVTVGRQRILIDDQRFVGSIAWRQDEQTFDAVRADFARGRFKATYAYVTKVNRVLGELKDWDSDSHLLNATWSPAEALRLQGFAYVLDFRNSPANASITKGIKASGKTWVGLYQLAYNGTWARQEDYRSNTAPFGLDYVAADLAGTFDIYTLKLGWESLEGNGRRGFTTPLATAHAFNGWSDAFAQAADGQKSFVDGLDDANLTLNLKPRWRSTYLFNLDLIVRYHHFDAQRTGADLGHEWNVQLTAAVTPRISTAIKYADFEREAFVPIGTAQPPASRTKVWLTLEYRL